MRQLVDRGAARKLLVLADHLAVEVDHCAHRPRFVVLHRADHRLAFVVGDGVIEFPVRFEAQPIYLQARSARDYLRDLDLQPPTDQISSRRSRLGSSEGRTCG